MRRCTWSSSVAFNLFSSPRADLALSNFSANTRFSFSQLPENECIRIKVYCHKQIFKNFWTMGRQIEDGGWQRMVRSAQDRIVGEDLRLAVDGDWFIWQIFDKIWVHTVFILIIHFRHRNYINLSYTNSNHLKTNIT